MVRAMARLIIMQSVLSQRTVGRWILHTQLCLGVWLGRHQVANERSQCCNVFQQLELRRWVRFYLEQKRQNSQKSDNVLYNICKPYNWCEKMVIPEYLLCITILTLNFTLFTSTLALQFLHHHKMTTFATRRDEYLSLAEHEQTWQLQLELNSKLDIYLYTELNKLWLSEHELRQSTDHLSEVVSIAVIALGILFCIVYMVSNMLTSHIGLMLIVAALAWSCANAARDRVGSRIWVERVVCSVLAEITLKRAHAEQVDDRVSIL